MKMQKLRLAFSHYILILYKIIRKSYVVCQEEDDDPSEWDVADDKFVQIDDWATKDTDKNKILQWADR